MEHDKQWHSFLMGMKDSIPISIAFFFIFSSIGTLCNLKTYTLAQSLWMTAIIFASPLQAVLLQNMNETYLLSTAILTTLLVNFRFFLMATTFVPYFKSVKLAKVLPALLMFSASTFTVSYIKYKTDKETAYFSYYVGVGVISYLVSILAVSIGYLAVNLFDSLFFTLIMTIVLPIHFSALVAMYWPTLKPIVATVLGFFLMPLALQWLPNVSLLVVPLFVGLLIITFDTLCPTR